MQSAWEKFKTVLGEVVAVVLGILALLFFVERGQKEQLEEKLLNKDTADKDKELKQQQDALEQQNKQTEQTAEEEKKKPMTEQETIDFLNKIGE